MRSLNQGLNIKEKKITIADFEKEISEAEGTQRDLLVVGKKRLELDLEELEQNKKLQAPLVKDAIEELVFYDSQIKKIEAMGLNPNFEEAEQEYHKTKVLRMARADKIARALGVDRGTIELAQITLKGLARDRNMRFSSCLQFSQYITKIRNQIAGYISRLKKREKK